MRNPVNSRGDHRGAGLRVGPDALLQVLNRHHRVPRQRDLERAEEVPDIKNHSARPFPLRLQHHLLLWLESFRILSEKSLLQNLESYYNISSHHRVFDIWFTKSHSI